jgi:HPt (histidine-containing phosphotransfer) domain-containing protein
MAVKDSRDLMFSEVLERLDGDMGFFLELANEFLLGFESSWLRLKGAVEGGNYETVHFEAHSLKSALANLGAVSAAEICGELEKLGRFRGDLGGGGRLIVGLWDAVGRFQGLVAAEEKKAVV